MAYLVAYFYMIVFIHFILRYNRRMEPGAEIEFSNLSYDKKPCPLFHAFDFPLLRGKYT